MAPLESRLDRRTLVLSRTIFVLRVFLGLTFLLYGIEKILGGQFFYGDWSFDKKTVDGGALVFGFFGYSPVYARFLGLCEALPAVLLFFRRTATLGAAILFAVGLNITVMDFCYDGMLRRVKYVALAYTVMLGFLLLCDWPRLRLAFWPSSTAGIATAADTARVPTSVAARIMLIFGGVIFFAGGVGGDGRTTHSDSADAGNRTVVAAGLEE